MFLFPVGLPWGLATGNRERTLAATTGGPRSETPTVEVTVFGTAKNRA